MNNSSTKTGENDIRNRNVEADGNTGRGWRDARRFPPISYPRPQSKDKQRGDHR
jgi:hypothetical protein